MTLLESLACLHDNGCNVCNVCEELFEANAFDDSDEIKGLALYYHLAKWEGGADTAESIAESSYDDCLFSVGKKEYLVLNESEKEERWDECLESYLDDGCVDGADSPYFDRERWKSDARIDGAGHALAGYDFEENEIDGHGAGWFFIYRVN